MKTLHWLIATTILIILAAACGSDGDSSDEGSADIAAPFSFEAFGNENFEKGQPISLDTFAGHAHRPQLLVPLVSPVPP